MISHQSTRQNLPAAIKEGIAADITTVALAELDLAFALDETELNVIASLNALPAQPISLSTSTVAFSGTLMPMDPAGALSCGVVGGAVASGVVATMLLTGTATVNGNSYTAPFTFQVLPYAFALEEQGQVLSTATQDQLDYLVATYGAYFQSCCWGLDYSELTFLSAPPAPAGWAAADWTDFCQALQAELTGSPIPNGQITLMQGIVPNGQATQWNFGPTAWCCFNVPPLDDTCQPAVIFGFMVSNHAMSATAAGDFQSVRLFSPATPPNALLLASSGIVIGDMVPQLMPMSNLQAAAQIAVTVSANGDTGLETYDITQNVMTASSTTPAGGWPIGFAGSTQQQNQVFMLHYDTYAYGNTVTASGLAFAAPDNGLNQQLVASGSYTVSGSTSGNQLSWQFTVPQAIFSWSIAGAMQVSSGGIVSFQVVAESPSFPDEPENNANSDYGWWTSPPGYAPTLVPTSALAWGDSASAVIQDSFCAANTNGQFNLFAFPGGSMWQDASGGINQSNNMVLNLTYVIDG